MESSDDAVQVPRAIVKNRMLPPDSTPEHTRVSGPKLSLAAIIALMLAVNAQAASGLLAQVPPGHPPIEAKKATAELPVARIDINSASVEQLKTLPGIGDAEAKKIIAGRPYLSKVDLTTKKVLPEGVYIALKDRIVAVQKGIPVKK